MTLELKKGTVRLGPNQTLKVVDAAGSTVSAIEGSVWITEENQANDIVLTPGDSYRLRQRGDVVRDAFEERAFLPQRAPGRERDLDDHNVTGARDAEIARVIHQVAGLMLRQ